MIIPIHEHMFEGVQLVQHKNVVLTVTKNGTKHSNLREANDGHKGLETDFPSESSLTLQLEIPSIEALMEVLMGKSTIYIYIYKWEVFPSATFDYRRIPNFSAWCCWEDLYKFWIGPEKTGYIGLMYGTSI